TDCGDVHRLAGPGIIDPEPIHQKGHRLTRLEMHEIEFACPSAGSQREAPAFVARSRPVSGNKKVENGQPRNVLVCSKANNIEPGAVNELKSAVQIGKADEIGRAFDEGDETPFVGLHLPALQCDGCVVRRDTEKKALRLSRKVWFTRAGDDGRIAPE